MRIEITAAGDPDREAVEHLAQLYYHDFTEFDDRDVEEDGRFPSPYLGTFFDSDSRCAYIVRVDGRLAGFAFVSWEEPMASTGDAIWYMSEFFVMRKYRRRGVGSTFATTVFARHTGTWEVAQMRRNVPAQAFWHRVIGEYTTGEFTEVELNNDDWVGPVQVFKS